MRRLMAALCIASGFVLVADAASARPRGGGSSSKSSVAKSPVANNPAPSGVARPATTTASKPQDRGAAPRTWIVAVPRAPSQRPAQAAAAYEDQGAPLGLMPSAAASDAKSSQPESAAVAPAKPGQENTKLVVLNPSPRPKALPSGPQLPYDIGVCYWNRAGQCER